MLDYQSEVSFKLSGIKPVNDKSSEKLHFQYQPNFILVDAPSKSSAVVFGDILPFYSSYQELTSIIVTSWEALNDFILRSSTFIVCILSFFNQAINNAAYQTYLLAVTSYEEVLLLPERYSYLKNRFSEMVNALATSETRELWWIEVKIDIRRLLSKAQSLLETFWLVTQKFYLSILVFICLGILNLVLPFTQSSPSSFLSNFVQNYSFTNPSQQAQAFTTDNSSGISTNTAVGQNNTAQVQKIIEYKVKEGDSIQKISEMYGVTPTTIQVNNSTSESELRVDQKIYIPFANGYIVNLEEDTTPDRLSQISNVAKENIVKENEAIYDKNTNNFLKGSLVLIPTEDVQSVANAFKKEQESKKRPTQTQRERNATLSQKSVSADTYKGFTSSEAKQAGFIWPTTGVITRCIQPGHIACDIANFSSPAIYAVQDGVITTVSYYDIAGYGLAVAVDHGNGIKSFYAHLSEIYVTKGQKVKQGEAIGRMGQTGWATGIHLHFEVIVGGVRQNPLLYLS